MDAEERFISDAAQMVGQELVRELDKEIFEEAMLDTLVKDGWTQTNINPSLNSSILTEIDWYIATAAWVHIHARSDYKLVKGQWLFKDPKDATMFALRWA